MSRGKCTSSGKTRRWFVRIPIDVYYAEGEFNGERCYGCPERLALAITARTGTEAAEKLLDAIQKAVDDA